MKTTKGRHGFTVLELLVALGIGLVLVAAAYAIYISQHRGFEKIEQSTRVFQTVRMAVDQLTRELHMAGFGVTTGETFTEAKKYSMTFLGDIDTDIETTLSQAAAAGDTQLKVDLRHGRDTIGAADRIFINGGGNVEMILVRQSGAPVDMSSKPDIIYLNAPLAHSYAAGSTLIRTIEQLRYAVTFPKGVLTRDNVTLVEGLKDFEFHYFGDQSQEMVPDAVNGLNQIQRAAIRRVELRFTAGGTSGPSRTISEAVEMRNMGNRPFTPDTCKPNAPTGLTVTQADTCGQFGISWTAPTTNACDGSALTDLGGYKVYYGTASRQYFVPPAEVSDETLTADQLSDLRLQANTTYYVTIRAYDRSWNESADSNEITFQIHDTHPPAAPTGLEASSGVGQVSLIWTKPADTDLHGYRLYRGTGPGFVANAGTLIANETVLDSTAAGYTDTGLTSCVTYYYKVSAVDCINEGVTSDEAHGDGPGSAIDAPTAGATNTTPTEYPPTPPSAPNPFQAISRNQAIDLVWTNPADRDTGGVVIRFSTSTYPTSPQDGQEIGNFPGGPGQSGMQTHSNLTNGVTYFYSAFAYDRCGNYSARATASARPGGVPPVVMIISPTDGQTITNSRLVLQARAYDPDQGGLHNPPSFDLDNGAGIASMQFTANPNITGMGFPATDMTREYCGFGGDSNPCSSGDISSWCDGTYQFYATATDDEGDHAASSGVTVTVHDGGIYRDPTITPMAAGTYKNEVTFQLKNDASVSAKILSLQPTWDIQDARLESIQIPDGTTIWSNTTSPAKSGDLISIDSGSQPTIAGLGARSARFVFTRNFSTLSAAAPAGSKVISVKSTTGFAVGDTIYVTEVVKCWTETAVIDSLTSTTITLHSGLAHSYPVATTYIRHTAAGYDVAMTNATVNLVVNYQKTNSPAASCASPQITLTFNAAPELNNAQQDQPAANTPCSTILTYIKIENYRTVPVHIQVTDHSGMGLRSTDLYYKADSKFSSVAPSSGYAHVVMTYSSTNSRWEATIPYQSNVRVWLYFQSTDNNGVVTRSPTAGAYAYDYIPDTTAPFCPLGITATVAAERQINLSWIAGAEPDIAGYNIYRSTDCGSFSRVYSRVGDADPNTPGVQYVDDDVHLRTSQHCYTYYVTAVDMSGNESSPCQTYIARAGATCPCH